ncbi:MAG TPA: alpha/beta fold hydrolase [Vicinamibacterales bacterium]
MTAPVLTHRVTGPDSGVPVLLLNGGMMTFASWGPIADDLARVYRVVAFDLRGMLLSPGTPPSSLEGHVADVIALLDHLGLDRVHLVGTSFGGEVAILLAASHPDRARSLSIVTATERTTDAMWNAGEEMRVVARDAAAGGDGGKLLDLLMPGAFSAKYRDANAQMFATRRQQFAAMPSAWFAALDQLLASLKDLDLGPALARVQCPTLVVGAELDATFPPEHSRAIAAAVRGARLEIVPASGHALVAEQPAALLAILWSFLPSA